LAASGVGGLLGAAISQLSPRPRNKSPLKYQPLVWTLMLVLLAAMGGRMVLVMSVVMLVLGLAGAMGNVELDTYLLANMPEGKFARVTSYKLLLDFLAACLGPAFGGLLFVTLGTESSIIVLLLLSGMMAIPAFYLKVPDVVLRPVPGLLPEPLVKSLVQRKFEWSKRNRHRERSLHVDVRFSLALELSFRELGEGDGR